MRLPSVKKVKNALRYQHPHSAKNTANKRIITQYWEAIRSSSFGILQKNIDSTFCANLKGFE